MKHVVFLWLCWGLSVAACAANGKTLTDVNEIVKRANLAAYYAADDGTAEARLKIVDAQGNTQVRQFTILRKDRQYQEQDQDQDQGDQDILVFFSRPSDVKGTVFRVAKKVASDDDRWLYLPALDLVKRISAGDKRTSFVGSHFFYEDVSGRNPNEDNFTLLNTDGQFYTLKATPKNPLSVVFDHYISKIDKTTFLPDQVTYYNKKGEKTRQLTTLKTRQIDGITTVLHAKMVQFSDNSYTEMQFRKVKYNRGLPQSIFSQRSLRTPPKAWMK
ncbi:MAG: outer membrane lipoprotein-sorting protein [Phenylobacterium sp.]|jgi:outer membrane lipoprotein-sorting protein